MYTLQQAFDTAALGIINQGGFASSNGGMCYYRDRDSDRKCGVGHLISDKYYKSGFENQGVVSIQNYVPELKKLPIDFLVALQAAHDLASLDPDGMKSFRRKMRQVAIRFNLSDEVLGPAEEPIFVTEKTETPVAAPHQVEENRELPIEITALLQGLKQDYLVGA